ncbi:MAG: hypothetical protein ACRD9S_16585, partial [Pyrinomonadaceae bacterium]
MNLKKLSIDEFNNPILIVVFILLVLLDGAFAGTHWTEWIHWKWTAILKYFAVITTSVFFVSGLSYGFAELLLKDNHGSRIKRSRVAAYLLCCVLVLTFAVLAGLVIASPVYPGDEIESTGSVATEYRPPMPLQKRDAAINTIFWVSLLPALLGVRLA